MIENSAGGGKHDNGKAFTAVSPPEQRLVTDSGKTIDRFSRTVSGNISRTEARDKGAEVNETKTHRGQKAGKTMSDV